MDPKYFPHLRKHNLPEQDSKPAMSSENLLKNGKKHVVIVGAGAAGMVSHDHLLDKNLLTSSFTGVES